MIQRSFIGVRIGFVIVAVACYFGSLALCAAFDSLDQTLVLGALEKLIMAIGLAVVGDTLRPSGVASIQRPVVSP